MGVVTFVAEFDTSRVEPKVIKMNKDFDRLGASVRKYLEASRGPLDKIYSKLGDIQEKMNKIPQALDNMLKIIDDGFAEINRKLDDFKGKTKDLHSPFSLFMDDAQKVSDLEKTLYDISNVMLAIGVAICTIQPEFVEFGALIAGLGASIRVFIGAFKLTSWLLEITGLRKVFDDLALTLGETFKAVYDVLKNVAISLKNTFTDVFKQILDVVINTFISIKDTFIKFWEEFYKGLSSAWAKVEAWFTEKIDWIKSIFDFSEFFKEAGAKLDEFKKGLSSAWGRVEAFFDEKIAWIKSVFDISDFIRGVGKQIIDKFKQGLSDAWEGAKDFFTKNVVNWLRDKLQLSNSPPFTIPYECGLGIMAAYVKGMKGNMPLLESTLNEITTKVETGLQIPEVDMNQWFLDNIPYERDYSNLALLPPVSSDKTGIDQSQTKTGSGEDAAKDSGFFGGLWSSFKSGVDDLKKQFGFGEGKGLLGNLFGGKDTGGGLFGMLGSLGGPQSGIVGMLQSVTSMIPGIGGMISNIIGGIGTAFNALKSLFGGLRRDIKGLIKYVCYRNYTNFLYKRCCFSFAML